jgi:hypothetical protein
MGPGTLVTCSVTRPRSGLGGGQGFLEPHSPLAAKTRPNELPPESIYHWLSAAVAEPGTTLFGTDISDVGKSAN